MLHLIFPYTCRFNILFNINLFEWFIRVSFGMGADVAICDTFSLGVTRIALMFDLIEGSGLIWDRFEGFLGFSYGGDFLFLLLGVEEAVYFFLQRGWNLGFFNSLHQRLYNFILNSLFIIGLEYMLLTESFNKLLVIFTLIHWYTHALPWYFYIDREHDCSSFATTHI